MDSPASQAPRSRWRLSIAAYLTLGLGGLIFLAVASVLALTLLASFRNTSELLEDKSRLLLGSLVKSIEQYLDPAEAQVQFIARMLESDKFEPGDDTDLLEVLHAIVASAPQTHSLAFLDVDGVAYEARREDDAIVRGTRRLRRGETASLAEVEPRHEGRSYWVPPVYLAASDVTAVSLRRPVFDAGELLGMVVAAVDIRQLAAYVATLETEYGQNAFVLYDRDYVLAHTFLVTDFPGLGPERPLPRLDAIGDPVLAAIWRPGWEERRLIAGDGHTGRIGQYDYVYLYAELDQYGAVPWLVGSYFAERDIATQVERFVAAAVAGLGGLVLAVATAVTFGRAVRGPIDRLATAAEAVRGLDLEHVPRLPRSRFRELDSAASAFNAMLATLRAFALYVPRDLVRRLLARGDVTTLTSEVREVTVMFTDIATFTSRAERMGAEATASFLNEHFDLVTACVEAEGGVVDKFLGDGVMALWGAVEDQPDHAARAVRAAAAIARAVGADNARRRERVRIRIGLHSGPVVVGNIGSRNRMNYTVVGDPVNAADRLQHLGKALLPGGEATILLSASTRCGLGTDVQLHPLGRHRLRGRDEPTEVFALAV